jgi:demethylmenaquinone methyltransferase / 2-methoxy-6-polyprenyl-1,4-benzoquinol methylase
MENKETPRPLHGMFNALPAHYDFINHIITLGMDGRWRRQAAQACLENSPQHVLDIGCGTGDLSLNIARMAGNRDIEVTGLDYSLPMLETAQRKAQAAGLDKKVKFIEGDAVHIPFPDGYFDVIGISFAFRNLTYKNPLTAAHFAEVLRALRPGGHYVAVESSQPENAFIRACDHLYLRAFVYPAAQLISANKGAYKYLVDSAGHYFMPKEVKAMLLKAGFSDVHYKALFFGAAGIHVATK